MLRDCSHVRLLSLMYGITMVILITIFIVSHCAKLVGEDKKNYIYIYIYIYPWINHIKVLWHQNKLIKKTQLIRDVKLSKFVELNFIWFDLKSLRCNAYDEIKIMRFFKGSDMVAKELKLLCWLLLYVYFFYFSFFFFFT